MSQHALYYSYIAMTAKLLSNRMKFCDLLRHYRATPIKEFSYQFLACACLIKASQEVCLKSFYVWFGLNLHCIGVTTHTTHSNVVFSLEYGLELLHCILYGSFHSYTILDHIIHNISPHSIHIMSLFCRSCEIMVKLVNPSLHESYTRLLSPIYINFCKVFHLRFRFRLT